MPRCRSTDVAQSQPRSTRHPPSRLRRGPHVPLHLPGRRRPIHTCESGASFAAEVARAEGCSRPGLPQPQFPIPSRVTSLGISFPRLNPRPLPEAHKCRRTPNSSVTQRELSQDVNCLISALKESPSRWVTHQRVVMCSAHLKHLLSSFLYPGLACLFPPPPPFLFLMNRGAGFISPWKLYYPSALKPKATN